MSQNQLDVTCDRHLLQHSPDSSDTEIPTILSDNEPITDPTDNCDVALSIILCAEGILSFLLSENIVCLLAPSEFLKMKQNVIKESLQSVFPAHTEEAEKGIEVFIPLLLPTEVVWGYWSPNYTFLSVTWNSI